MKTKLKLALAQVALIVGCSAPVPALAKKADFTSFCTDMAVYVEGARYGMVEGFTSLDEYHDQIDETSFPPDIKQIFIQGLNYAHKNPFKPKDQLRMWVFQNCMKKVKL